MHVGLAPKHRLHRPKFRFLVEPAEKDEVGILPSAGDDVFPTVGQTWRGIHSEEVTRGGLAKTVQMVMGAQKRRFGVQCHSDFLGDLARDRCLKLLVWIDATCRYLRPSFGMVPVLEDQKLSSPLDVDDNPLATFHRQIVGAHVTAELESRFPAIPTTGEMT